MELILRVTIGAALGAAAIITIGAWAVTTRRLNPFSPVARGIRAVSDPVLVPLERLILRRGGNPQNAPWWLLGLTIIVGILLLSALDFVTAIAATVERAVRGGPRDIIRLVIWATGQILIVSLIVRVVGQWLGAGRYNPWTRWSWRATDWLVEPIRRWIPAIGMFDFSPLVAWFVVWVAMGVLLGIV